MRLLHSIVALAALAAVTLGSGLYAPALAAPVGIAIPAQMRGLNLIVGAAAVPIGATGDVATIALPPGVTKYRVNGVAVANCASTPAGSPLVNMWTGAGGTGTQVGAFSTVNLTANTTPATITTGTSSGAGVAITTSIMVNVQTAASSADTCSFYFLLQDLTGL